MELVCNLTGSGVSRYLQGCLSLAYVPLALWGVLVTPSFKQSLPLSGSHTPGTFRLPSTTLDKLKRILRGEREVTLLLCPCLEVPGEAGYWPSLSDGVSFGHEDGPPRNHGFGEGEERLPRGRRKIVGREGGTHSPEVIGEKSYFANGPIPHPKDTLCKLERSAPFSTRSAPIR